MLHGSRFHMDWDDELSRLWCRWIPWRLRPLLRWLKRKQRVFAAGPGRRAPGIGAVLKWRKWRELNVSEDRFGRGSLRILFMANWQTLFFGKNNIWLDMRSLIESSILVGDALSTQLCFFYGGSVGRKMRKARWVRCLGCEWCHWMIVGTIRIGVPIPKCPNSSGFWLDLLRNLSISTQTWTYHCAKPICKLTFWHYQLCIKGPRCCRLSCCLNSDQVGSLWTWMHCFARHIAMNVASTDAARICQQPCTCALEQMDFPPRKSSALPVVPSNSVVA